MPEEGERLSGRNDDNGSRGDRTSGGRSGSARDGGAPRRDGDQRRSDAPRRDKCPRRDGDNVFWRWWPRWCSASRGRIQSGARVVTVGPVPMVLRVVKVVPSSTVTTVAIGAPRRETVLA